jgi:small subunit ribosomal protein S11
MADKENKEEQKQQPAPAAPAAAEAAAPAPVPAGAAAVPGAEGAAEGAKPVKKGKTKGMKNVPVGIVHIHASFNNTTVTITDVRGAVVSWSSAGRCGFKGSRRSTAYAATLVAQEAGRQAVGHGMHEVEVRVQGPGAGRESAIRAIQASGLNITAIRDVTPMPHNGCRAPKRRRV